MDHFLHSITNSVGFQIQGMNSTIEKTKDEGEDRYKRIDERIASMEKKFSMIEEETSKIKAGEFNKVQEDQNHGKAVATGFYGDSTEQEVEQLLRETIAETGMSTENVEIKCPAKPITYAEGVERVKFFSKIAINGRRRKISPIKGCDTSNVALKRDTALPSHRSH